MAGIYVHFPYCQNRCIYCDFYSRVRRDWDKYVDALLCEIAARKDFLKGVPPRTLYFGGGTPSLLPYSQLSRVVEGLRENFDLSEIEEFTIECNPDDISPEKASELRLLGASRISMGVQSFCDAHLKWMRRRHTAEDARRAFLSLRAAGFDNISIDLIFGFQGLSDDDWAYSIDEAMKLSPEHISCYQMMGRWASDDEAECRKQYLYLAERLSDAGYEHYEISNYCKPGKASLHNSSYWTRDAYLGLGAAAHSFNGERTRSWNVSDLDRYIAERCPNRSGMTYGGTSGISSETLSDAEADEERLMLGLRTSRGVDLSSLVTKKPALDSLVKAGYIIKEYSAIRIPEEHFFVSDWIISQLF